jgi:hypothetical protein
MEKGTQLREMEVILSTTGAVVVAAATYTYLQIVADEALGRDGPLLSQLQLWEFVPPHLHERRVGKHL